MKNYIKEISVHHCGFYHYQIFVGILLFFFSIGILLGFLLIEYFIIFLVLTIDLSSLFHFGMATATNSSIFNNSSESTTIVMNDDAQCSAVVKHFFSDLCTNIEKNRWSSKCKTCSSSITDTYKTTSNFLKHLKIKHQGLLDEWKTNQEQPMKDKNQPKINDVFSPDGEKCEYVFIVDKNKK